MKTMTIKRESKLRCSSLAAGYARVLLEMEISEEAVKETREIFKEVPQLSDMFANPTVALKKKMRVIDRVFPQEIGNFLKAVCRYRRMRIIDEIFTAYDGYKDEQADIIHACLTCTTPPDEGQIKGIENFLCRKYSAQKAKITVQKDDSLIGGFILRVGSDEYDRSIRGRMDRLEQDLRAVQVRYS